MAKSLVRSRIHGGTNQIRTLGRTKLWSVLVACLMLALVAIASAASGSTVPRWKISTSIPTRALKLVSGDGAAPHYVVIPAQTYQFRYRPGVKGLFQLRWGQGGPPVLVPLAQSK